MSDKIDLKKLAEEAGQEARRDILASPWCRVWHTWTRWEHVDSTRRQQTRWCMGCGKEQKRTLARECRHVWRTDRYGDIVQNVGDSLAIGKYYDQTCRNCGAPRRKSTYTSSRFTEST